MITPAQALMLLETIAVSGPRPPEAYLQPARDGLPSGKAIAAKVYAATLNNAGISIADAEAAVSDYLAEPDPGQYPKPWPDPGKLIARTPTGRAAAHLGSDADADAAFVAFRHRLALVGFAPSREDEARHLDPTDAYRNDAMFRALEACGGSRAWGAMDLSHPAALKAKRDEWVEAYRAARAEQRQDKSAVRALLVARASVARQLTDGGRS